MRKVAYWLEGATGLTVGFYENLLYSIIVVAVLWGLSRVALHLIYKREKDYRQQYKWRKFTNYVVSVLNILLLANIWLSDFASIATFLGLFSAGLVVALREPLLNLAGWLFIIWKRPFHFGDRVQIGEHIGDVIDIRLFQFTINEIRGWVEADQATGRIVNIPNGRLFTTPQANYNYGFPFVWQEIPVRVTFESNWQKAKSILLEVASRHAEQLSDAAKAQVRRESQRHLIFYDDLQPDIYTSVQDNGIQLTVRYMCSLMRRRKSSHLIWEEVLAAFLAAPDIQFAYPTTRFYQGYEGQSPESPPAP
ncbi:small-conductance mechanosensitive channel [Pontibacter ummariensis]|uniref:Small-conductance mechanosensitive channel n=1 Tax=Pontibacter ummariensis TaxID=1610492 RepID=A0A239I6T1_9BACT|nr:mechanosensitive ion channel family protein [Pontibacter ummariensis]PRY10012.1 small-conductance mechanosensitive channel [Pontibacter ummariensis]SNS89335.1 Small-conductance mechanosensitive channel [Pontibacter ummariensis]